MNNNIYDIKNIELLCPDWHETLWDLVVFVKEKHSIQNKNDIKNTVLSIIKQLLEDDVIYIIKEFSKENEILKLSLNIEDTILYLENKWKDSFDFPEYYSLNFYGFNQWYINSLRELGYTHNNNWIDFVSNNIGNIQEWIKDKKAHNTM